MLASRLNINFPHQTPSNMPAFTFKIDLLHSEPLVTRTFKVSSESTLFLLHHIIQVVMGWKNAHLYEFTIDTLRFTDTRIIDEDFGDFTDVKTLMLEDVFPQVGAKAHYLYDFGDGWEHQLELIQISQGPQNELMPSVVSGQNACPPEDCGGVYGYKEMIKIIEDPTHEEHESMIEWVGPRFNPSTFNPITIHKELGALGPKIKSYERRFK